MPSLRTHLLVLRRRGLDLRPQLGLGRLQRLTCRRRLLQLRAQLRSLRLGGGSGLGGGRLLLLHHLRGGQKGGVAGRGQVRRGMRGSRQPMLRRGRQA